MLFASVDKTGIPNKNSRDNSKVRSKPPSPTISNNKISPNVKVNMGINKPVTNITDNKSLKPKFMIPITSEPSIDKRPSLKRFSIDLDDETSDTKLGFQNDNYKSGFVTILGNPNVGKSTLLNALLKEKLSIVSAKPQTTRHRILGVVTEKGYQIVFSDTPGMLKPSYKLQEAMMESVSEFI